MKSLLMGLCMTSAAAVALPAWAAPLANRSFEQPLLPAWTTAGGAATITSSFFGILPTHRNQMMRQDAVGNGFTLVNSSAFELPPKARVLVDINLLFSEDQPSDATAASGLAFEVRFPTAINNTISRQVSVETAGSTFRQSWRRAGFVDGQDESAIAPNLPGSPGGGFVSQTGWLTLEMVISDLTPLPCYPLRIFTDGAQAGTNMLGLVDNIRFLPLSADYDNNRDIDGRDFLDWQRGGSSNPHSSGDLLDWQLSTVLRLSSLRRSLPFPNQVPGQF